MLKHLPRLVDCGGLGRLPTKGHGTTLLVLVELADFPLEIRVLEERGGF